MKTLDKFLESRFHDQVPTLGDIIHHWSLDWAGEGWSGGLSAGELRAIIIDGLERIESQIEGTAEREWDWEDKVPHVRPTMGKY